MRLPFFRRRRVLAFTLVELLVVIAIIGLLASLTAPALQSAMMRAKSVQCASNLRSIGLAAMQAATDNDNTYPEIDQAAAPIYPPGSNATNLVGALGSYGITTNTIQCPIDMMSGAASSFQKYKSSYEWNPVLDDGSNVTPILTLGNIKIPVHTSRVRLCTDFLPLHNGKMNAVYGDGHVNAR